MRIIRNLSVGAKLGLSVALALALLVALGLSSRYSLHELGSLQARSSKAAQTCSGWATRSAPATNCG